MFSGLREHEMRSNPCIIEVKIPFDPNIMNMEILQYHRKIRHSMLGRYLKLQAFSVLL